MITARGSRLATCDSRPSVTTLTPPQGATDSESATTAAASYDERRDAIRRHDAVRSGHFSCLPLDRLVQIPIGLEPHPELR